MLTSAGRYEQHPVLPGAEPFASEGRGERASTGILLVHGFTGSPVSLRPLAELLAERGFRVELPRLPGHGTHHRDMARTRYSDWRDATLDAAERLRSRSSQLFLVGLSMGGTLVLDVAATCGWPVSGVVTINAQILDRGGAAIKLAPLLERVLPFAPAALAGLRKDDIKKPHVSEQAYAWVPVAAGNSLTRELPRVRAALPAMKCPILVVHSREDHSVPPENSRAVLALVGSADKTELVLERSYHVATLDHDLPLLDERIAGFCERVAGLRADAQPAAPT